MNNTAIKDLTKENCCKCICHEFNGLHMMPCCHLTGEIYIVDGKVNEEMLKNAIKKHEAN